MLVIERSRLKQTSKLVQQGFTLVELIIGIVVFSIVLTIITGILVPQTVKSIDPIYQVRATEFAQSLLNEISAKAFDESSIDGGARIPCASTTTACTPASDLIAEEANRVDYDDVDDYNSCAAPCIANSLDENLQLNGQDIYAGFSAQVSVFYDDDMDGLDDAVEAMDNSIVANRKRIQVTVTTPNGQTLDFAVYRSNF